MKPIRCIITALIFFAYLIPFNGRAQMVGTGKEFFMTLMDRSIHGFSIVSKHASTVTFHYFADPDLDTTFVLVPNEVTKFTRGNALTGVSVSGHEAGVIDNKSMVICADSNINVIFVEAGFARSDASTIYPVVQPNISDFSYYTIGVGNTNPGSKNGAVIVSHFDDVELEITPKYDMGEYTGGEPIFVTLNRGDTYAIYNMDIDLTGSTVRVISSPFDNPITLLSSYSPIYIYTEPFDPLDPACCADGLLEQTLPIATWDTMYHFVPFMICDECEEMIEAPSLHAIVRVVSSADDNPVYINGSLITTLEAGSYMDTLMDQPAIITSAMPIAVAQFALSASSTGLSLPDWGDPDQMWLHPMKGGIRESIFEMLANFVPSALAPLATTLTLITDSSNHDIWLDEINIDNQFIPYAYNPRYRYMQKLVDNVDQHHLLSSQPVIAYVSTLKKAHDGASYALSDLNDQLLSDNDSKQTMYICEPITLQGRAGPYTYTWSTGSTDKTITVDEQGIYWVTNTYGCSSITDTFSIINVSMNKPLPPDTLICSGYPKVLNAYRNYFTRYLWNTGDTTSVITVSEPGVYTVTLSTEHCPALVDTIVLIGPTVPDGILPPDSLLCDGIPVILGSEQADVTYMWNTGASTCCITAMETGLYIRNLTNKCNESFTDSSRLKFVDCDQCLLIPTAFSPNGDGLNDKFTVLSDCMLGAYRLDIFNRYGQRIFISYDPNDGWDGTFNGVPVDLGVYFYYVQANHILNKGEVIYKKGDVTLVR